jgi:hypothetical protein
MKFALVFALFFTLITTVHAAPIRLLWDGVDLPATEDSGYRVESCETDWRVARCDWRPETPALVPRAPERLDTTTASTPGWTKCFRVFSVARGRVSLQSSLTICHTPGGP